MEREGGGGKSERESEILYQMKAKTKVPNMTYRRLCIFGLPTESWRIRIVSSVDCKRGWSCSVHDVEAS